MLLCIFEANPKFNFAIGLTIRVFVDEANSIELIAVVEQIAQDIHYEGLVDGDDVVMLRLKVKVEDAGSLDLRVFPCWKDILAEITQSLNLHNLL